VIAELPPTRHEKVRGRQRIILSLLRQEGYHSIHNLADKLGVSIATARRDLTDLEDEGLVARTHGGVLPVSHLSTSHEPTLDDKQRKMVQEKMAIGRLAATLVSPGETVILDSGSTTWQVGQQLKAIQPLTVVSNDLRILWDLANVPGHTLVAASGVVRSHVFVLLGTLSIEFFNNLNVNWTFLGADAIDPGKGITNVNIEEAAVKRAMIRAARSVAVVADHTKFAATTFAEVCPLDEVDCILTDDGIDDEMAERVREVGVRLMTPGSAELALSQTRLEGGA
jgi:DeoR/GlpR family transcriptional regulator of sugar metabolism